jgi:hypothetical protein
VGRTDREASSPAAPGALGASGTHTGRRAPGGGRDAVAADRPPLLGRTGRVLRLLFPASEPPARRRTPAAVAWLVLANAAAIAAGAVILLERQPGRPAWQDVGNEDYKFFLAGALAHPGSSLWTTYNGYLQTLPRLIAEVVARFPFRDADVGFAVAGAVTASCCAVFVFHASAGHIRTPALRALLAVSVLLLPTALYEITNSDVNTIWYLLFATFWALLWRPRSRAGRVLAGLVCLLTALSNVLAIAYLPLVVARVIALPRVREQAATIGWVVGGALQVPAVLAAGRNNQNAPLPGALGFYARNVILAGVFGHHWAAVLTDAVGIVAATAIAGCIVAAVVIWACLRGGPRVRVFVLAALITGFILTLLPVLVHGNVASPGEVRTLVFVHGSRYAQVPILILYSLAIVTVDGFWRRPARHGRAAHGVAVVVLVAMLGTVWVSDYRFVNRRASAPAWSQIVSKFEAQCAHHPPQLTNLRENVSCWMLRR